MKNDFLIAPDVDYHVFCTNCNDNPPPFPPTMRVSFDKNGILEVLSTSDYQEYEGLDLNRNMYIHEVRMMQWAYQNDAGLIAMHTEPLKKLFTMPIQTIEQILTEHDECYHCAARELIEWFKVNLNPIKHKITGLKDVKLLQMA